MPWTCVANGTASGGRRPAVGRAAVALLIVSTLAAGGGCGNATSQPGPAPTADPRAPSPTESSAGASTPTIAEVAGPAIDGAAAWSKVVAQHVRGGLFDYASADRAMVDAAVAHYAAAALPADRQERLALWINAYNANVVALVLAAQVRGGFTDVIAEDGFFDGTTITVCQEPLTLNQLENGRIRTLDDPRIHAALVCAAMSCPPLRAEPFDASRLDEQLDDQCMRWVNDATKFGISDDGAERAVRYSRILEWYGDDFDALPYSSIHGFVFAYADPAGPLAQTLATNPRPAIEWIEYDWTLNQAP